MANIIGEIEYRHGKIKAELVGPSFLTDALRTYELVLNTRCGGRGTCGGCAVDLHAGTYRHSDGQEFTVEPNYPVRVLACKTQIVAGPFRISIPRRSLVETGERVVADFVTKEHTRFEPTVDAKSIDEMEHKLITDSPTDEKTIVRWNNEEQTWQITANTIDKKEKYYGLAVDIGTTTVAMSLIDMTNGIIVDTASCYNQQVQMGDNVISRIIAAGRNEVLQKLQQLIIHQTINPLIHTLCRQNKIKSTSIFRMAVSCNTVMWHLLLGIDPSPLGVAPFKLANRKPKSREARDLGIDIVPQALIDIVPSISAYVGGDIVSDIESSHMMRDNALSLLIDIGTNGEIAIRDGEKMLVTACAAGPAFEGLRISHGMRASTGAIERITMNDRGECKFETIGNAKPVGICGSGLIDFLAEGFRHGLIAANGRFDRSQLEKNPRLRLVENNGRGVEYIVADRGKTEDAAGDITVSEKDIETIVQAKGALFAAIRILLKRLDRKIGDIGKVYLAGGFAKYIDIRNAVTIGLLPEIDLPRYVIIGNGSLAGAHLGLIDRNIWSSFDKIIDEPQVVELNLDPDFQDEFTFAMFLPNYQEELFTKKTR
jgi:uncharacterized 2Fe-2S/4Fe-4S cluster protein (DUF4445 family)